MKRYYYKGEDITYTQFKINDISYPKNWCQIIDDTEILKLGIIIIDDEYPIVYDNILEVDPNIPTYAPIDILIPKNNI